MKTDQKFLNELYTIKSVQNAIVNKLTIQIELNRDHDIFKGHFPGNPVLPGVCTIQILKELLEIELGKNLNLIKAGTIKYLSFIDPVKNSLINYEVELKEMENGSLMCNSTVHFENTVFCSFKGEFSASSFSLIQAEEDKNNPS